MTALSEAERVAKGLTEAQREGLTRAFLVGSGEWAVAFSTGSANSLMRDGLAAAPNDWTWPTLTPLGPEVRKLLEAQS